MRRAGAFATTVLLLASSSVMASSEPDASRIRDAALRTYIHGMTDTIAQAEVGPLGVPVLHDLLVDPSFPRHDNVVAMLAYLGGSDSTPHLIASLSLGALDARRSADDRAALLVPEALARIAERGDRRALRALLALTRRDASDGALPPSTVIDADLARQAVRALAFTGASEALARLAEIGQSANTSGASDAGLASSVAAALGILDARPGSPTVGLDSTTAAYPQDPNGTIHEAWITWANHVAVTSPVGEAEAAALLHNASVILGTARDAQDVACCATLVAMGSAATFGSFGDGGDIIDDDDELMNVLAVTVSRVKVVREINSCGGAGTNIIGCSPRPGFGMVVVHLNSLDDAPLWAHEYGHNVGLSHRSDPAALMYPSLAGGEGLIQSECAAFHAPPPPAQMTLINRGACGRDDDSLAAQFDNCPGATNADQADFDGDGVGDACEVGRLAADADQSGRVDGFDLARLGRSFGSSTGTPRYDLGVDLDRDGVVDGEDLAALAAVFGLTSR